MSKKSEEIERALLPLAESMGLEIVDVALGANVRNAAITVFIHKAGGVSLEDCERFHRAVDPLLDELDPTGGRAYTLNVSSPGLDRAFTRDSDFKRNLGEKVEAKLFAPLAGGKKAFVGKLSGYDEKTFTLSTDEGDMVLEREKVAKVSLYLEF